MNKRYALATDKDIEAGLIWSTGRGWNSAVPKPADLLTGPEVDDLVKRHPSTNIVDVLVYREKCRVHGEAFNAVLAGIEYSTQELRSAAREAGRLALIRAGYKPTLNPIA